jgi:hypothetical protein
MYPSGRGWWKVIMCLSGMMFVAGSYVPFRSGVVFKPLYALLGGSW